MEVWGVTLITVGNSEGARHCDARCYDADPTTPCECVCGGRNHGVGLARARAQTAEMAEQILARAKADGESAAISLPLFVA